MGPVSAVTLAAALLLIGSFLDLASNLMFTARRFLGWFEETPAYLAWERGLLMAAYVLAALGVAALEFALRDTGGALFARLAATAFLVGVALALVIEAAFVQSRGAEPPLLVAMVLVLFLAEALLGGALLTGGLMPAWVGGTVVAWNLGMPVVLAVASPGDVYYPVAHFFSLVLIGVALLAAG